MPAPVPVEAQLQDISHTIQLAVAPVFLLTAIGTTLGVLANRLSRIVDRTRRVEPRLSSAPAETAAHVREELRLLARRTHLIHWALTLGTSSALFVCLTIAAAFVGYIFDVRLGGAMAFLFLVAITAYVGALLSFLREIFMAIRMLPLPRADSAGPNPPP